MLSVEKVWTNSQVPHFPYLQLMIRLSLAFRFSQMFLSSVLDFNICMIIMVINKFSFIDYFILHTQAALADILVKTLL